MSLPQVRLTILFPVRRGRLPRCPPDKVIRPASNPRTQENLGRASARPFRTLCSFRRSQFLLFQIVLLLERKHRVPDEDSVDADVHPICSDFLGNDAGSLRFWSVSYPFTKSDDARCRAIVSQFPQFQRGPHPGFATIGRDRNAESARTQGEP